MSDMFKYLSGEVSGKEAELAATVEHTAGYLSFEIEENAKMLARINRAIEYINDLDRHGSIDHGAAMEIKRRLYAR